MKVGRDGERVEIAVADSGPGVPEAERELIFEPFVSDFTRASSVGLGLFVVPLLVVAAQRLGLLHRLGLVLPLGDGPRGR